MAWEISAAGRPSGHWRHQDRHIVVPLADKRRTCIGVLDGHGEDEKSVEFCLRTIEAKMREEGIGEDYNTHRVFLNLADELRNGTDAFEDGCALSLAILGADGRASLMTIGDTFACAGRIIEGTVSLSWIDPHEVFGNDEERARLKEAGAKVGHGYVHDKADKNLLAMSRSLGDAPFQGIVSREMTYLPIGRPNSPHGQFVILGTDGYFNMAMPERMNMSWLYGVKQKWKAHEFLQAATHRLRERADDATVAVAYF